jgi:hypothetical protein
VHHQLKSQSCLRSNVFFLDFGSILLPQNLDFLNTPILMSTEKPSSLEHIF